MHYCVRFSPLMINVILLMSFRTHFFSSGVFSRLCKQTEGFRLKVSGKRLKVSEIRLGISGFGLNISGLKLKNLDAGVRLKVLGVKFQY